MSGPLLVLAAFAVVATLLAWARWLAGRRWAAAGHLAMATIAAALVAVIWPVARHLSTYEPVAQGNAVAELYFEQAGARRFRATLTRLPSGRMQVFDLAGDQWRLDARQIEWSPSARKLGLRPLYRLERLAARGKTLEAGGDVEPQPALAFALGEERGSDPWSRPRPGPVWDEAARATTLETPWQPMVAGRRFEVRLQENGLVVAPYDANGDGALQPR